MTNKTQATRFAALIAVSLSLTSQAEEADTATGLYVDFGVQQYNFASEKELSADPAAYFGLGYQFTEHWAAALKYSSSDAQYDFFPNSDRNFKYSDLSAIYRYNPRNESSFFWKMGIANTEVDGKSGAGADILLGMGYNAVMNSNLSFNIGVDAVYDRKPGLTDNVVYLGLSYIFGGETQPVAPTPAPKPEKIMPPKPTDSDRDGVIDSMDQCPATPGGVSVDQHGCESDSDGDGIPNSKDACPETPQGAKVDGKGCRVYLTKEVSITLDVKFANNSNQITDDYRGEIKKVADFMRQYPDTRTQIVGHTDSTGSAAYNKKLSQQRANAVRDYLIREFGIDSSRLSAIGKGEEQPIADNSTAEGRSMNRRVEAKIKTLVKKAQ